MSNLTKGEIAFDAGGQRYTLCYSINALCRLEEAFGGNVAKAFQAFQAEGVANLTTMRTVFWAGLCDNHPSVTIEEAGLIMSALGLETASGLAMNALTAAFPKADPRPLAAPRRPGKRS